jgi:predicted RNA-binding protein
MSEAHASILNDAKEEEIPENVDEVHIRGEEIRLISILGEQRMLKARIKSCTRTQRKILLEANHPVHFKNEE